MCEREREGACEFKVVLDQKRIRATPVHLRKNVPCHKKTKKNGLEKKEKTCTPQIAMQRSSVKWLQLQFKTSYESEVYLAASRFSCISTPSTSISIHTYTRQNTSMRTQIRHNTRMRTHIQKTILIDSTSASAQAFGLFKSKHHMH